MYTITGIRGFTYYFLNTLYIVYNTLYNVLYSYVPGDCFILYMQCYIAICTWLRTVYLYSTDKMPVLCLCLDGISKWNFQKLAVRIPKAEIYAIANILYESMKFPKFQSRNIRDCVWISRVLRDDDTSYRND